MQLRTVGSLFPAAYRRLVSGARRPPQATPVETPPAASRPRLLPVAAPPTGRPFAGHSLPAGLA